MSLQQRFNVHVSGDGPATLVFAHGFGCDQNMWRLIAPGFAAGYRVVLFDLVGHGMSDLSIYNSSKYSTLEGYATDVLDIVRRYADGPAVYVGHSVSAMIGMLAAIRAPDLFAAQIMVSPSPSFVDDGDYVGGFSQQQIDDLLALLDDDYLAWANLLAPLIMGSANDSNLTLELTNSFCRNDPEIARNFARAMLKADHRADLPKMQAPTLILQCTVDAIAPRSIGEYMARRMPRAEQVLIDNIGHCPHLSNPHDCAQAMHDYLDRIGTALALPG
jgi:sigma-B regulation protein RsbQ